MTTPTPVISERPSSMSDGRGVLESSVSNAEVLWRAFAAARGHRIIDEPDWLAVDAGKDIGGTRVILRGSVTGPVQRASLNRLVDGASRPVVVEDPFASIDLSAQGLAPRALSVMGAGPFTRDAPHRGHRPRRRVPSDALRTQERPGITMRRVEGDEGMLLEADRIVVEGFPLTSYQPYRPGRLLPAGLLNMAHISVFVAVHLGKPCGTCMTVKDPHGVGGVYWVAVLPEHRRAGIGRALMLAAMRELAGLPMVLCATSQGAPLYRTLGFETALASTYWQAGNPT
jgi:ribosomal protein S18 acetylase RimI-like enzyme